MHAEARSLALVHGYANGSRLRQGLMLRWLYERLTPGMSFLRANPRLTAQTTLFNVARLAIGAVNSVLLARWMGPTGRGTLAAALLLPPLLLAIGGLGLEPAFLFFSASEKERRPLLANVAVYFAIVQSVVLCPIGYVLIGVLYASRGTELTVPASFYLLTIPAGAIGAFYLYMLLGAGEVTLFNWMGLIIPVGYLLTGVLLHATDHLSVTPLIIVLIGLFGTVSLLSTLALRRRGIHMLGFGFRAAWPMTLRVAKYALKAQLRDASTAINTNFDQLVIASMLPASQLAYYAVAVSVTAVLSIFPMAIQIVSAPQIAGEPEETKRQRLVQSAVGTLTRVSVPLGLIAAIALPIGTRIVLGPEWDQALKPEVILIAAGVVLGFKNLLAACAAACGDPWLASRAELLGVVVTVLGLVVLIPAMGIVGAALTSLIAYTVAAVSMTFGFRSRLGIHVLSKPE